jgi:hypothetical protein
VKPDEAREWVDPTGSHCLRRPAPIAGYIASYRTCRANTRTSLLELYVLTGSSHLDNWSSRLAVYLCFCLELDPSVDTARNNSCIVAIVGYHGNSVYRAVAWIPICVPIEDSHKWTESQQLVRGLREDQSARRNKESRKPPAVSVSIHATARMIRPIAESNDSPIASRLRAPSLPSRQELSQASDPHCGHIVGARQSPQREFGRAPVTRNSPSEGQYKYYLCDTTYQKHFVCDTTVHSQTWGKIDYEKDNFYEELERVFDKLSK